MFEDEEQCYRAVQSRDPRFDGWFFGAVTSTGIYCRPSCPARTPKRANMRFYATAAAAQLDGFRACKRCRPDATPGSPEWNQRADLVGRAMRLIADGVVDREGVAGLARQLNYSERHLNRQLVAEVGAGPIALARAQRAQTARILIETTELPFARIAFASGFASIRQFNDTIRAVFAMTPSGLRSRAQVAAARSPRADATAAHASAGTISLRLPFRAPLDAGPLLEFLDARAVAGIESVDATTYRRSMHLPFGAATAALTPLPDHIACTLRLDDLRDLPAAVQRCRRLLDLDADPVAVIALLEQDPLLAPLVRKHPGLRVPGHVDGVELLVRAIVGPQVSVTGARAVLGRITNALGTPLAIPDGGLTRAFPTAAALAAASLEAFPMPKARAATVQRVATAVASGELVIDPGVEREELRARLLAIPGVGPWTVAYVGLRALGDPDVFLPTDLGARHALEHLGCDGDARAAVTQAESWRPWRSYALMHLWTSLSDRDRPMG
jgi:AraC family transcriptional regulator, regulatory protein of adaptative response / DNA-3-methyladenine glycosylase II